MVEVSNVPTPLSGFADSISQELVFGQVLMTRLDSGFELRHVDDRERAAGDLKSLSVAQLRELAQRTAHGAFRPLKSAPNLQRGWRSGARDEAELDIALTHLYPGAVADWFAAQASSPPVTDVRAFTDRQTGMYRVTAKLTNVEAALVTRACCPVQFCLKRRLWTVEGLEPDEPAIKSKIPCLEPCAIWLEFARTAVRVAQASALEVSSEDLPMETGKEPAGEVREADFSSPRNPRRIQLEIERLQHSKP